MKKGWDSSEVKCLFDLVEDVKKNNVSILEAFKFHAKKYDRNVYSVRNFYYKKVDEINKNKDLQDKLKVNMSLHEKNNFAKFDDRQTEKLLNYINGKVKQGKSVRSACLELSKNNATLMIRYQNKYHSLKNKIAKVSSLESTKQNKNDLQTNNSNILSFPTQSKLKPQKLTDDEIKSLFIGLLNLVKKSTLEDMQEQSKLEREKNELLLKKSIIEINEKTEKIDSLKQQNKKLSSEINELKSKLMELRSNFMQKQYNKKLK
ncbi:MAG: hypothetical protein KBT30_02665 [Clostridiales bacterium]|nr:hypothetical protein [Candidatus Apopatousia equi]